MTSTDNDYLIIGRFGSAHGVKGYIKVQSFTSPKEGIIDYKPWLIEQKGQWQPLPIEHIEAHAKQFVVKLSGVNDRNAALAYTNKSIAIDKALLAPLPKGDYYWNELIGMQVSNRDGIAFGDVKSILETGSNDVLVVEDAMKQQRLIPYLPEQFVQVVDREKRHIVVDWDADF